MEHSDAMTRVKLAYPKISDSSNAPSGRCVACEKYDGTNLHWVWERELGWYAFGMRRNRFDVDEDGIADCNAHHAGYADAPAIFNRDCAQLLEAIFQVHSAYGSPEITVFTEYVGQSSFAGLHKESDTKQWVLFDVATEDGMIAQRSSSKILARYPLHALSIAAN
jgi:hypothetical protein